MESKLALPIEGPDNNTTLTLLLLVSIYVTQGIYGGWLSIEDLLPCESGLN